MLDSPPQMPSDVAKPAPRLHIGSGKVRLEGWINIDVQPLPGVDVVADVTRGLDFAGVEAIFAEHFLEHLSIVDAMAFLQEAQRVLAEGGWIRLSTPNLDWVWFTHYRLAAGAERKRRDALALNRAFHGWRHRFLWNREILGEALLAHGFADLRWCRYGESEQRIFQGLERHQTDEDAPELPHVIIAEARKGVPQPDRLLRLHDMILREFLAHLAD
jgi:SAM-dependent methyltransferase